MSRPKATVSLATQPHILLRLPLPALSHYDSSLQCHRYWTSDHPGETLVGASGRLDMERRPKLAVGGTVPSTGGSWTQQSELSPCIHSLAS